MSHKRLTVNAIAPGEDIDKVPYADQYVCDGCGVTSGDWQMMTRVQGGSLFRGGAIAGYLNADLCAACWVSKPLASIVRQP